MLEAGSERKKILFSDVRLMESAWRHVSLLVRAGSNTLVLLHSTKRQSKEASWNVTPAAERHLCLVHWTTWNSEKNASKTSVLTAFVKQIKSLLHHLSQMLWDVLLGNSEIVLFPLCWQKNWESKKITFQSGKTRELALSHQLKSLWSWHRTKEKK